MRDRILANALHLLLNTGLTMGAGFAFWWWGARSLEAGELGLATAAVSAMLLLGVVAKLGFDFTLVRLLPAADAEERGRLLDTFVVASGALGITLAAGFILVASLARLPFAPLLASPTMGAAFALGVAGTAVLTVIEGLFLAEERADAIALKNGATGALKLVLLFPLVLLGASGVVGATAVAAILVAIGMVLVLRSRPVWRWRPSLRFDAHLARRSVPLTAANFAVHLAEVAPTYFLPIVLASWLGPEAAGHFYVAWLLVSVLHFVPVATATSFLASAARATAARDENALAAQMRRAIGITAALLLPSAAVALFAGPFVLGLVGSGYAVHGADLLRLCVLASPLLAANLLWTAVLRARGRPLAFTTFAAGSFGLALALLALFSDRGLVGVGLAWLLANAAFAARASWGLLLVARRRARQKSYPPRGARAST